MLYRGINLFHTNMTINSGFQALFTFFYLSSVLTFTFDICINFDNVEFGLTLAVCSVEHLFMYEINVFRLKYANDFCALDIKKVFLLFNEGI